MSSVLTGSNRPYIRDSTFNVITTYQARTPGFEKLTQAVSPNAFYDSDDRPDPPKCHENTRVAVIDKIMEWVTGRIDADAFILWLYGPAGAGKTAIARTIAELCEAQGLLLASFLFFRSDSKRNTMTPLIANIAYCFACVIPCAREHIEDVINTNPLILSYSLEVQLTKLILGPLRLLEDQGYFLNRPFPRLVLIDGLDECLEEDAQTKLIQLLSSSVSRMPLPLKFLLVSRPEAHIKSAVARAGEQTTISHLELNNDFQPDKDIHHFFTGKFREIKRCHPNRSRIPPVWPTEQQIETLVRKASGQFIYASLAVRFANSPLHSPTQRLDIVLELRPPTHHDLPFAELDTLYCFIFSSSNDPSLVQRILGLDSILNRSDNAYCEVIEYVLGLEDGDVRVHLSTLSSLLEVKEDDLIHFHHSSFIDFICNRERSTEYCIDSQKSNSLIAQWILQFFTSDGLNMCLQGIDEWWRLRSMDLLSYLIDSSWTLELQYALEHFSLSTYLDWLDHLHGDELHYSHFYFPEMFLDYLEKDKPELHRHNSAVYVEHDICSINNPKSSREKFCLLSTVWIVLQKPFSSLWMDFSWGRLCVTLFGFDSAEVKWDCIWDTLMCNPTTYREDSYMVERISDIGRLVPQPILSQRLAHVAISCMRYLRCRSSNTASMQDYLLAWAVKSKRSPWLLRRRMKVILTGQRRQPALYRPLYSSLRQSRQILFSKGQSEKFYNVRHAFYIWTLDLLYRTLRKAMKSDELLSALSKPFIPSVAPLLFPGRIKRVRKAVDAYLEKFGPVSSDTSNVEQNIVVASNNDKPECSEEASLTGRNTMEENLKRNFENMLDVMNSPTGVDPKTIESVNALFDQVNKVGGEIGRNKRRRI